MPNPFETITYDRMTNVPPDEWPLIFTSEDRRAASWNREQAVRDTTCDFDDDDRTWCEAYASVGMWTTRWDGNDPLPWVSYVDKWGNACRWNDCPVDPALSAFADFTEA